MNKLFIDKKHAEGCDRCIYIGTINRSSSRKKSCFKVAYFYCAHKGRTVVGMAFVIRNKWNEEINGGSLCDPLDIQIFHYKMKKAVGAK